MTSSRKPSPNKPRSRPNEKGLSLPAAVPNPPAPETLASPNLPRKQVIDFSMDPATLRVGKIIGKGNFGVVREARWRLTPVAIKFLFNTTMPENEKLFIKELMTMQELHHPNIVQFLGFVQVGTTPAIVMELFPNSSLEDYVLQRGARLSYATRRRFAAEMVNAVAYLHGRRPQMIIHRDIKPSNFLLTNSLRLKLGDFGIARFFGMEIDDTPHQPSPRASAGGKRSTAIGNTAGRRRASSGVDGFEQTGNCGTVRYRAPEVFNVARDAGSPSTRYSQSADIYSLGLSLYFVFEGVPPRIPDATNPRSYYSAIQAGRRPIFMRSRPEVRRLVEQCWAGDPKARLSANELAACVASLPSTSRSPFGWLCQSDGNLDVYGNGDGDDGFTNLSEIGAAFNEDDMMRGGGPLISVPDQTGDDSEL